MCRSDQNLRGLWGEQSNLSALFQVEVAGDPSQAPLFIPQLPIAGSAITNDRPLGESALKNHRILQRNPKE
jgi:hypothetical protein